MKQMTEATNPDDRIILRQSWLGQLAMCPERARQDMLGISQSTESSNTAIGTAVHYGIEQCLIEKMETGDPLPKSETICASIEEWVRKEPEVVRWNHKTDECVKIIKLNTASEVNNTPNQVRFKCQARLLTIMAIGESIP